MSVRKTVDLLKEKGFLYINGYLHNGAFVPGLYARTVPVSFPSDDKIVLIKYSVLFDKYFLFGNKYVLESPDGQKITMAYAISGATPGFLEFYNPEGKPCYLAYNTDSCIFYDGVKISYPNEPTRMIGAIMHCGRIFFIPKSDKMAVGWSAPLDILNLDESIDKGGWIKLNPKQGEILQLVEYGEKIVALREYGLTVLKMMGSPENYRAEITNTDYEKIIPNTGHVIGDKVYFFTTAGLCAFDGSDIKKEPFEYADYVMSVCSTCVYQGRYYIDCEASVGTGGAVFCYDPEEKSCYNITISHPTSGAICVGKEFLVYNNTARYKLENTGTIELQTGKIYFGSKRYKVLKEIYVDVGVDLSVSNGRVYRTYKSVDGVIRPRLKGKYFTIIITVNSNRYKAVREFTATAEECDAI